MAVLDLVQVADEAAGDIVRRVPEHGAGEFRLGSQLVVRESQQAVFVRDGKALDVFGPGRHTLSTNNIPLLGGIIGSLFGGNSPFTAEVYFVNLREFTNLKWGSAQPVTFRDTELGMVRLRAFGTYSLRVKDSQQLVNQVVGARGAYRTSDIEDFLRSVIIQDFTDTLGALQTSLLDLPKLVAGISSSVRATLADDFAKLGFELTSFQVEAITPPEDVQKLIDQRSGMAAIGNMDEYIKFQTAQGIRDAANNPGASGDGAGVGVGLGAGIGLAGAMAGAFRGAFDNDSGKNQADQGGNAQANTGGDTKFCTECGAKLPANAKFCPGCGAKQG